MIQSPCRHQVLTGILPYNGGDGADVIADIRRGKRPPRPTHPSRSQWLQGPIWNTITTCWSGEPGRRHKLSVVYNTFSKSGRQVDKRGDLTTQNDRNSMVADIETGLQQRGRLFPWIPSLFQFLRDTEPEIEGLIDEMDKVAPRCIFPSEINRIAASRGSYYTRSRTAQVVQHSLQDMQQTSCNPKIHAHP